MTSSGSFRQTPITKVSDYWNSRPCNIRHSAKEVGSREYFDEVEERKYFVEYHIPGFAQFDRWKGKRLNRPNDVVCKSDGSIYFTDPGLRVPFEQREVPHAAVYRVMPDGTQSMVADFEYPNGLAFSPDERLLYVANTRWAQYIHALELDANGALVRRRIFAEMPSDSDKNGVPDGMKVDVEGRVYCTGPDGTWVFAPDGTKLGIIRTPEFAANVAFGGPDLKTLFFTANTSVYTLRMKVSGQPHPWYRVRGKR